MKDQCKDWAASGMRTSENGTCQLVDQLPLKGGCQAITGQPGSVFAANGYRHYQNYLPNRALWKAWMNRFESTKDIFEAMRTRLLDLTRRNRLINCPLYGRRTQLIRVIDEIPDLLFQELRNETFSTVKSPQLDDDPADKYEFVAFAQAQIIDEEQ